jgi:hypothetical protein
MSTDINIKAATRTIEPETVAGKSSVRKIVFASQSGRLGDFIVPVRIDAIPFSDIPIQIHNKNVMSLAP